MRFRRGRRKEPVIRRALLIGLPAVLLLYLGGDQLLRSYRDRHVDDTLQEHQGTLEAHDKTLEVHDDTLKAHDSEIEQNSTAIAVEKASNQVQGKAIEELQVQSSTHQQDLEGLESALELLRQQLQSGQNTDATQQAEIDSLRQGLDRLRQLETRHQADRREIVELQEALDAITTRQQQYEGRLQRIERELGITPPPEPH